ncbi:Calcium-independent phospholipase A2-gamma [Lachnellula arida]|uniref:Calcium-independent phospholipase A2-gamma n=1 Tax=Lachnellula arida TaxID=1316785 RepID=A0A8T9B2U3_9HELO|nr:Calcium-independent phospholipase A2-gamma [Lachnellula arida]
MARSTWLTLRAGLWNFFLHEHHQPYSVLDNLPAVHEQTPQMVTFIGRGVKSAVMEKLHFNPSTQNKANEIHLQIDASSIKDHSPILLADCELHNAPYLTPAGSDGSLGDIVPRPLLWHNKVSQSMDPAICAHLLYAKLISPFSTVICLFEEDLGGLSAVAEILVRWLMNFSNRPSDLPPSTHPRVLILTNATHYSNFDEQAATKQFMNNVGKEAEKKLGQLTGGRDSRMKKAELDRLLAAQFGGMRLVGFPGLEESHRSWKSIKARILRDSNEVQKYRQQAQVAFSALHFKAFFHMACDHFCSDITSPFSFVRASRFPNPIPENLQFHLLSFLKKVDRTQILNFAVPIIASALMFDSYPSGMHGFHPEVVFQQFFYKLCLDIDPFNSMEAPSPHLANAIQVAFCQYAFEVLDGKSDQILVHRKVLHRFKDIWESTFSNNTCLACLVRKPENTLQCSHVICAPCTAAYANSNGNEPYTFWIEKCPLCCKPNAIKFKHKPDTAGVRAIITEGGGVRGVVPLSFLKEIEHSIGLPINIQEHFDIAFGSSSGALITLGLFFNRWSVEECIQQFQNLSSLAFRKRRCFGLPLASIGFIRRSLEVLLSFATDSRYGSAGINAALKTAFGSDSYLFNSETGGTKVAIVATTTEDSSTCIFTNYNMAEDRSQDCGYKLIRPASPNNELRVWETADDSSARASSAAPPYFQSFQGYQDGGLGGHNNPINLALWEQDTIWSRQKKQPDIILSLGTGFKKRSDIEGEDKKKPSFFRARCIPRLFRSFLNFFVGESRWQELQNSLPHSVRHRYHRMNIEFNGDEPELDDLHVMASLRQQAKIQALSNDNVRKCADNLVASFFYLELDRLPAFERSLFSCTGRICCRIGPTNKALQALAYRLKEAQARFYLSFDRSVVCVDGNSYEDIRNGLGFSCPVAFETKGLIVFLETQGTEKEDKLSMGAVRSELNIKFE